MRRLLVIWALLLAAVCAGPSFGQLTLTGAGKKTGAVAYQGPGDIVSGAKWWIGLRGYNAAYASRAINVCNVSDVACVDMSIGANGNLVITTVGGSDCGVVVCTIKTWYDQSGALDCTGGSACDFTNATAALRPTLVTSCLGSLPCAACTIAGSSVSTSPASTDHAQPFTVSSVAKRTGDFTTLQAVVGNGTFATGFDAAANKSFIFYGSIPNATVSDSAFHGLQWVFSGAASDINVDGSANVVSVGTTGSGASALKLCNNASQPLQGNITELGLWASAFSSGNSSAMSANQHSYWGF